MWITNPGDDDQTPDPTLPHDTLVNIRFRGESHHGDTSFDDTGPISEWYWRDDEEPSDIVEYQIIKEHHAN